MIRDVDSRLDYFRTVARHEPRPPDGRIVTSHTHHDWRSNCPARAYFLFVAATFWHKTLKSVRDVSLTNTEAGSRIQFETTRGDRQWGLNAKRREFFYTPRFGSARDAITETVLRKLWKFQNCESWQRHSDRREQLRAVRNIFTGHSKVDRSSRRRGAAFKSTKALTIYYIYIIYTIYYIYIIYLLKFILNPLIFFHFIRYYTMTIS